ncbi:MAG: DUF4143 domain-containing protein, partial [Puniceicoccales bacterium]|nr:DUF4143 domain-containing protein [Puniceicoccales bacterium]
ELRSHPVIGASWETFVLEDIQRRLKLSDPYAACFFWRTADGHEADLLIERGGKPHTLIEVKLAGGADPAAARRLAAIAEQLGAARACILSQQNGADKLAPGIERLGPDRFLMENF